MRGHLEGEVTRIRACARVRRAVEPPPASGSIAGEARSPRISAGDDVSSHPGSSGGAGASGRWETTMERLSVGDGGGEVV